MKSEDEAAAEPDGLVGRWHDNLIYSIGFDIGDAQKREWRSDLVLDIDFIAEWVCDPGEAVSFRVAPATLTFHDVGDLAISIDYGDSAGRTAITECSIDRVTRERLAGFRENWRWSIRLNMPRGGKIDFCASGFTETMRQPPRLLREQRLPPSERHRRAAGP